MSPFESYVVDTFPDLAGSVIEIGAGNGETTKLFAENTGRKIICIDPFTPETDDRLSEQYCDPYSVEEWTDKLKGYTNVTLAMLKSDDPDVHNILQSARPIAFAFVDGLQLKDSVLSDLAIMSAYKAQIIAVDDYERTNEFCKVPEAMVEFFKTNRDYKLIQTLDYIHTRRVGILERQ